MSELRGKGRVGLLLALPLVIGLVTARLLWPSIHLPYSNPWQVTGPLTSIGYNPANDFLRFGVWLGLPLLLLLLFWVLTRNRLPIWSPSHLRAEKTKATGWAAVALFTLAILTALNMPTRLSSGRLVDTFHEGETLGPAVSLLHGKAPYQDIIFLHGPYQDPLRTMLAFRLWGRSIGAVRTLESSHKIIAMLMLALLCLALMPGRPWASLVLFLGLMALQMAHRLGAIQFVLLNNRDMTTFGFLALCATIQYQEKTMSRGWILAAVSFGFVALPICTFAYSVDRGFFLTAAMIILWPLVFSYLKHPPGRLIFVAASAVAVAVAWVLVGVAIQHQWKAFFSFVFVNMPKYKELMDGFVFPIEQGRFLFVCLILATSVYFVWVELLRSWSCRQGGLIERLEIIAKHHLSAIALALVAVFTFRSALGRSDWSHVMLSDYPAFILAGYLLLRTRWTRERLLAPNRKVTAGGAVLLAAAVVITGYKAVCGDLLRRNFPLSVSDQELMRPQDIATVKYLRQAMQPGDSFYTLTSEGVWYYWLDSPSPIRHAIAWFAMPVFYQREIIRDLEREKVRFILVKNDNWPYAIDGIPNDKRLPLVMDYVRSHYVPHKTIGDNRLWIRRCSETGDQRLPLS